MSCLVFLLPKHKDHLATVLKKTKDICHEKHWKKMKIALLNLIYSTLKSNILTLNQAQVIACHGGHIQPMVAIDNKLIINVTKIAKFCTGWSDFRFLKVHFRHTLVTFWQHSNWKFVSNVCFLTQILRSRITQPRIVNSSIVVSLHT